MMEMPYGGSPFPPGPLFNDTDVNDKLNEDRYEVFVNGEFVGHKTLLNASDKLEDIDDFLKSNGFTSFVSKLDGDHYEIQSNDDLLKDTLEVYLHNR